MEERPCTLSDIFFTQTCGFRGRSPNLTKGYPRKDVKGAKAQKAVNVAKVAEEEFRAKHCRIVGLGSSKSRSFKMNHN